MSIGKPKTNTAFFRPVADGTIVKKITQEEYERRSANPNDNVRKREWTAGDKSGTAYEETYRALEGRIVAINFTEHEDYGNSINITLRGDEGDEGVLALNTNNSFAMSFMEALPNVDLTKSVTVTAWSKEKDGKTRKSMFITQDGSQDSMPSKFRSWDDKKKEWKISDGYPEVDEKEKKKFGDKKYWPRYFSEVELFLTEYIEKNIIPQLEEVQDVEVVPEEDDGF